MTSVTTDDFGTVIRKGLALVAHFVRGHPLAFALAVTGAAMFAAAIVASAFVVGRITDQVIIPVLDLGASPSGLVLGAVAAVGAVAVWKAAAIVLRRSAAGQLQFRSRVDLRQDLIDHQLRLRPEWFHRRSTGELLAVAETDANQATFVLAPLPFATGSSLLLVGTVVIIAVVDPVLGAITLLSLAGTVAFDVWGSRRMFAAFQEVQRKRGKVSSVAHESFDGALTVKALGREDHETERFARTVHLLRDELITLIKTWANFRAIVENLPALTTVVLVTVGALRVAAGEMTPGEVVGVAYLLSLLAVPVRLIGYVLWDLSESLAGWERVEAVLEADEFVPYGEVEPSGEDTGASIAGSDVGFGYRADESVLEDIHIDIPSGRTVAVVGPTGSGKSTLTMLLARLWDPSRGSIRLDGRDLRSFAPSALPHEVAFVAQEAFLFDDTVRGNITLGLDVPDEDVQAAARLAGAADFIAALPDGLDTRIGERGTTLSGGQRQRVALARALLRRPRLLILDDATSAVDPSIEARILRGLKRAELPSTVIVVAHRRASIVLADEVVFVDEGRIVAHGRHRDLLLSEPGYNRLLQAYEEDAALRAREAVAAETHGERWDWRPT